MSIYGSIGNHNSVIFRCIGRPCIIKPDIMSEIFCKNRSMKRTDFLNIESGRYFEKFLYLCTVFSYDTDKISSCLVIPWFFHIQRSELSKTICGKKNLFCAVISNHNFRPVNHRCKYESKLMISERKCTAVFRFYFLSFQIQFKKVSDHAKRFTCSNYCSIRIYFQEICNIGCMIRFHVLYNQIIRFTAIQNLLDIVKPLVSKICIYSIHNRNFFVQDHIRIIRHSTRDFVLPFKKVNAVIVYTYIFDGICDFHIISSVSLRLNN